MRPKVESKKLSNALSCALIALLLAVPLIPAIADQTESQITRTKDKPGPLSAKLSETLYRTEEYQAEYTVQVPYEDTEIYTERVPYEAQEEYQDTEVYTENEYRCHNETRYEERCSPEQKCHTEHRRECRQEQQCENVPRRVCEPRERCENVPRQHCEPKEHCENVPRVKCENREQCSDVPVQKCEMDKVCQDVPNSTGGTTPVCRPEMKCHTEHERKCANVPDCRTEHDRQCRTDNQCRTEYERQCRTENECRTEYDRQCHDREVCRDVPEQKCHTEQVCRQVPVPHQECRWEPVQKTRQVTKVRTVIKYRDEQRSRTVVKYRDETRCCVTRQRQVFDHEYAATVQLNFPTEATLEAGEREVFNVELTGVDDRAGIKITSKKAFYTYRPEIKQTNARAFEVKMNLVPTYQGPELGVATITDLAVKAVGQRVQLQFKDSGAVAKVKTTYGIQLLDTTTGALIIQDTRENTSGAKISWNLNAPLAAATEIRAVLTVARAGVVIAQPVQFVWDNKIKVAAEAAYDPKPYADAKKIDGLKISGKRPQLSFSFIDGTKAIEQVTTAYAVRISVVEKNQTRALGSKVVAREDLKADREGRYSLSLIQDLGIAEADLKQLKAGAVLLAELEARRTGSRLKPNPLSLKKSAKFKVK